MLPAWMVGFVIGYLMYDLTHYFIHHSNPPEGSYFKFMKTYHMQHHYKSLVNAKNSVRSYVYLSAAHERKVLAKKRLSTSEPVEAFTRPGHPRG